MDPLLRHLHPLDSFEAEHEIEEVSHGIENQQQPALLGLRLGPTSGESQRWLPDLVGSRTASWHILVLDRTESRREREVVLGGERTNEPPTPANAPFKLRP